MRGRFKMATKAERAELAERQAEARDALRRMFPKGATVTTMVLHVSQSGMRRSIAVLVPDTSDASGTGVINISGTVARALGRKLHRSTHGVQLDGCGMDMTFALVYDLSLTLYGDGYALNRRMA